MKASVIIPVYNEEKSIRGCLTTLLDQTLKDYEIIIVDDGSSDRTVEMVKEFEDKNVKLFKENHRGAGAARNLGAKNAKGEILVFVDADMTFDRDFLNKLIKPISRTIVGTFSKEEHLGNKDNVWARAWNINRGLPATKMHSKNYPDSDKVFRAITKEAFDRAGGFNENAGYTDDYSLFEKLGVMAVAAEGAVFYHNNPDTLSEVYVQSKWMAKRKYKLGIIGRLGTLVARSFPFSIIFGLIMAIINKLPEFLIFRIVSDFGQFVGIIEHLGGKVSK